MINLSELTIDVVHSAYFNKEYTAFELVEAYFDRIQAIDKSGPRLNAILAQSSIARAEASDLDSYLKTHGKLIGPLHGVPVILKDQIETKGITTTFGSIVAKDHIPDEDATLVQKLKNAGAIIIAKSTMPDWAFSWFSGSSVSVFTKNPYCLSRDPGGSSSGTAASIAANLALVGIGGDTGGSIRLPSSFCNIVGLRCTPGLISRNGMSALVVPQDTPGPMCRTVTDVALVLDVIVGYDAKDPWTATAVIAGAPKGGSYSSLVSNSSIPSIRSARLGVLRAQCFGSNNDPACQAVNTVINATLDKLIALGTELIDIEIPNLMHYLRFCSIYGSRSRHDIDAFLSLKKAENGLPPTTVAEIIASSQYPQTHSSFESLASAPTHPHLDSQYVERMESRSEFQRVIVGIIAANQLDAIVFPTCQVLPPLRDDVAVGGKWSGVNERNFPNNTHIASLSSMPSISVPVGFASASESETAPMGLPVGLEILGLPYREQNLLTLARGVELRVDGRREPIFT